MLLFHLDFFHSLADREVINECLGHAGVNQSVQDGGAEVAFLGPKLIVRQLRVKCSVSRSFNLIHQTGPFVKLKNPARTQFREGRLLDSEYRCSVFAKIFGIILVKIAVDEPGQVAGGQPLGLVLYEGFVCVFGQQ